MYKKNLPADNGRFKVDSYRVQFLKPFPGILYLITKSNVPAFNQRIQFARLITQTL